MLTMVIPVPSGLNNCTKSSQMKVYVMLSRLRLTSPTTRGPSAVSVVTPPVRLSSGIGTGGLVYVYLVAVPVLVWPTTTLIVRVTAAPWADVRVSVKVTWVPHGTLDATRN